jgi:acetyl-CoA decarbonylase/synthase complex subunit gamma
MALTGIQIYKLLPQTNCKECDFPTCLAFAMKLAAKQVELSKCPYVSDESAAQLAEASAPPVRPITIKSNGHEVKSGNEVVMFRHNKRFFSQPGLFVRVYDDQSADEIQAKVKPVSDYVVDYVGMDLSMGGIAVQARGGDFGAAVKAVRESSSLPVILLGPPEVIKDGLEQLKEGETPLIGLANSENWEAMAGLAKEYSAPLAVEASNIDDMAALIEKLEQRFCPRSNTTNSNWYPHREYDHPQDGAKRKFQSFRIPNHQLPR